LKKKLTLILDIPVGIFFAGYTYYQVGLHIETIEKYFKNWFVRPVMATFKNFSKKPEKSASNLSEDYGLSFDNHEENEETRSLISK
jgi:hypothetical protein